MSRSTVVWGAMMGLVREVVSDAASGGVLETEDGPTVALEQAGLYSDDSGHEASDDGGRSESLEEVVEEASNDDESGGARDQRS